MRTEASGIRRGGIGLVRLVVSVVVGSAFAAVLAGCGGPRFNVQVKVNEQWAATGRVPTLEVDLVGANPSDAAILSRKDLLEYFAAGDDIRSTYPKKTLTFTKSDPEPKTLEKSDPVWQAWDQKQVDQLFVLVNLPGIAGSLPGDADPRRLILPLDTTRWASTDLEVEVNSGGLVVNTPQRATAAAP